MIERWGESIAYLRELVESYPDYVRGWSQLATCYMQYNKTALAKETFDLVLQLDPNDTMTLQNYGKYCGCGLDHVTVMATRFAVHS